MKKKNNKLRPFSRRLTRWIGLMLLIVMGLASWLIYIFAKNTIKIEEFDLYKSYLKTTHEEVKSELLKVSVGTLNHVPEIEANLSHPEKMADIMRQIVLLNPTIHSCGISFIDGYYPQKGHTFCPFAVRNADGQIEVKVLGDAKFNYLKADWFAEALQAEQGYWAKPFYDSNDSTALVPYLVPIRDKQQKTVAILGADLSLSRFSGKLMKGFGIEGDSLRIISGNDPEEEKDSVENDFDNRELMDRKWRLVTNYFIIDKDGTYIAHSDSNRVIKDNYFELAKATPDTIDDYVGRLMVAGEKGSYTDVKGSPQYFRYFDMNDFSAYMFFEPIEDTNWSISLSTPRVLVDGIAVILAFILLLLIALGLFVVRIVGHFVIRRATKPLKQLADSANEVAKGNFNTALPQIKHNDEIRLLRDSFEGMQNSLSEYVDELKDTTASKAAIENELKVAHDIQMSMLPKTFPPYPERDDIDIFGMLTPAKDVGGDLFDFYIRNERLFFCIGDVTGKGVPASLFMAVSRSLFRNVSTHTSDPRMIVTALNEALSEGNDTNMFVTAFVGALDLSTGLLHYCNAGHDAPLLIVDEDERREERESSKFKVQSSKFNSQISTVDCLPNLPLGVMPGYEYKAQEQQLAPGTTIFLFTDGLNEAENVSHEQFGNQRIIDVAQSLLYAGKNNPTEFVRQMAESVHAFVGDAEQSDDLTMLAIKYV